MPTLHVVSEHACMYVCLLLISRPINYSIITSILDHHLPTDMSSIIRYRLKLSVGCLIIVTLFIFFVLYIYKYKKGDNSRQYHLVPCRHAQNKDFSCPICTSLYNQIFAKHSSIYITPDDRWFCIGCLQLPSFVKHS